MIVYILGTTPGPIFLGAIIDSSCDVWQESCGTRGSCWIYRKWDLGLKVMFWWMGTKFVGVVLLFIASILYKPPKEAAMEITITADKDKNLQGKDNPVFTIENSHNPTDESKNGFSTRL